MADGDAGGRPDRDRDARGRARSSRPRDAAGRPLPRDAAGVARVPEDLVLTSAQTLQTAQRLLDTDRPFAAHEVLEAAWKAADHPAERAVWQGLAQLAVGLTHAQRGNPLGAAALLRRGAERITSHAPTPPHGLALGWLATRAVALAESIERDGLPTRLPRLELINLGLADRGLVDPGLADPEPGNPGRPGGQ